MKMLGMIKRTFDYLNKYSFLLLYKAYIRPQLEYCQQACQPYLTKDIDILGRVQKRATKLVKSLKDLSYEERLKELKLYSLSERRTRADMIAVYKIVHGITDINIEKLFTLEKDKRTRGHSLQIKVHKFSKTEVRRNAFSQRVVIPWNELPDSIVNSLNEKTFKRDYDIHMLKKRNTL